MSEKEGKMLEHTPIYNVQWMSPFQDMVSNDSF